MSDTLEKISKAVIEGDVGSIGMLTELALSQGLTPKDILDNGLMPGMDYVGVEFRKGNMFVPEVLLSARAMQASMDIIRPLLAETGAKNLVCMMMEGAGFEIIDLGTDVAPEAFVETVKKEQPDIVGMSALLTTTMRSATPPTPRRRLTWPSSSWGSEGERCEQTIR